MQCNEIEDPNIKWSPQEPLCTSGHSCFTLLRYLAPQAETTVASVAVSSSSVAFVASTVVLVVLVVLVVEVVVTDVAAAAAIVVAAWAAAIAVAFAPATAVSLSNFPTTRELDNLSCAEKIGRP